MALADRDYLRDSYNPPRYTTILIMVLIGGFLLQSILITFSEPPVYINVLGALALTAEGLKEGKIWQLLTFQFLHAAPWPWHVLLNCLGLYWFARPVEEILGSKRFLRIYLLAGVAGGLLQVCSVVLPGHGDSFTVGASAGLCGVLAIFCSLNPTQRIGLLLLPITFQARTFLLCLLVFSIFSVTFPYDSTAHAAHLGGLLFGIAYVRWFYGSDQVAQWFRHLFRPRGGRPVVRPRFLKTPPQKEKRTPRGPRRPQPGSKDFISKEVDPILEKISAHGIHSLTEEERRILEAARERMEKR